MPKYFFYILQNNILHCFLCLGSFDEKLLNHNYYRLKEGERSFMVLQTVINQNNDSVDHDIWHYMNNETIVTLETEVCIKSNHHQNSDDPNTWHYIDNDIIITLETDVFIVNKIII